MTSSDATLHPSADPAAAGGAIPPDPATAAAVLAGLVDVLVPGDTAWPSAATVGVQFELAGRLIEERGRAAFDRLPGAVLAAGGPFFGRSEKERVAIVAAFEAAEPALFGWVRDAVFMAYYESPFVAAVINAQGHPYELRPHRKGYALAPFDRERDTPRHGRGHYLPTDAVRPVDVGSLDLETIRTQAWGLER